MAVFWVIYIVVLLIVLASLWILFSKAGKPGWFSIIPILNTVTLINIAGRPWWWLLLLFIPVVNFIILILIYIDIAKAFGKGELFGCGMIVFPYIFIPILAFGDARYTRPNTGVPA